MLNSKGQFLLQLRISLGLGFEYLHLRNNCETLKSIFGCNYFWDQGCNADKASEVLGIFCIFIELFCSAPVDFAYLLIIFIGELIDGYLPRFHLIIIDMFCFL